MRILNTIVSVTVLALSASVAGAADLTPQAGNTASYQDNLRVTGSPGITTLQLSPMYVEIQQVLDQAGETEQVLLKELAAAEKDEDVQRIIYRIERLEVDRSLAILKIQARYARLEGRWNLEYKLRTRIMEILENEAYATK
jgi:hypothetical protein